jgi:hypothetical protein
LIRGIKLYVLLDSSENPSMPLFGMEDCTDRVQNTDKIFMKIELNFIAKK